MLRLAVGTASQTSGRNRNNLDQSISPYLRQVQRGQSDGLTSKRYEGKEEGTEKTESGSFLSFLSCYDKEELCRDR